MLPIARAFTGVGTIARAATPVSLASLNAMDLPQAMRPVINGLLVDKGYSPSLAARLIDNVHPTRIFRYLEDDKPPTNVWRGVNTSIQKYDPAFNKGLGAYSWVTRDRSEAMGYTTFDGFMLNLRIPSTLYGTASERVRISRQDLPDDRIFTERIGRPQKDGSLSWVSYDEAVAQKLIQPIRGEAFDDFWRK